MTRIATPSTQSTPRRRDAGFTLIEMIVVLVLLGIASAAIFPAVGALTKGTQRTTALSQASGELKAAQRLLERDIRGAAGARSGGDRSDITTPQASVVTALESATPALHDITSISPTQLQLNSEVLPTVAGIEQVTWALLPTTAAGSSPTCGDTNPAGDNWCIVRTVRSATGAAQTAEVVVRGRGRYPQTTSCWNGAPSARRVFCYRENVANSYVWNAGWRPDGCTQPWSDGSLTLASVISPVRRDGFTPAPSSIRRIDRIATVGVTLPAGGGNGAQTERVLDTLEVSLRSRHGEAYQSAIMCGGR